MTDKPTLAQVQEFFDMMTGQSLPDGVTMANQPMLSSKQAFSVIWFLQEYLRILPDNIEMCFNCGCLYDTNHDGQPIDDESWDNNREFYEEIGVRYIVRWREIGSGDVSAWHCATQQIEERE